MNAVEINIVKNGVKLNARLTYKIDPPSIVFRTGNLKVTSRGDDLFTCLIQLREQLPEITFLCKGAKTNVHTSRMSSQMSCGLVAYELELGRPALRSDMVNIFDYEDKNLTNDPDAQSAFFAKWLDSLKQS